MKKDTNRNPLTPTFNPVILSIVGRNERTQNERVRQIVREMELDDDQTEDEEPEDQT